MTARTNRPRYDSHSDNATLRYVESVLSYSALMGLTRGHTALTRNTEKAYVRDILLCVSIRKLSFNGLIRTPYSNGSWRHWLIATKSIRLIAAYVKLSILYMMRTITGDGCLLMELIRISIDSIIPLKPKKRARWIGNICCRYRYLVVIMINT